MAPALTPRKIIIGIVLLLGIGTLFFIAVRFWPDIQKNQDTNTLQSDCKEGIILVRFTPSITAERAQEIILQEGAEIYREYPSLTAYGLKINESRRLDTIAQLRDYVEIHSINTDPCNEGGQ